MTARRGIAISSWLALGVLGMVLRAGAADFGFSASASPNPLTVSNTLTYSFSVTNISGTTITNAFLTNHLSYTVTATNPPGWITVAPNTRVFPIASLAAGVVSNATLGLSITFTGVATNSLFATNTATIAASGRASITTNLVTEVLIPRGDLQVSLTAPSGVLVNDLIVLDLTVTNLGPDTAPNVIVTNFLPTSFKFLGLTPTSLTSTFTNGILGMDLVINVGTLATNGSAHLRINVQPTNSGPFELGANVVASPLLDTNLANNAVVITNFIVGELVSGSLVATNLDPTAMTTFNPQTGLMEQTVRLVNVGTNAVPAARIIVYDLTNRLFNAVGTNDVNPFVVYGARLETNQPVDLVFEYFVPTRLPIMVADSQLHPYEMPAANLTPPGGTPFIITLKTNLPSGDFLIEFQATPGRSYTVLYSDNPSLTNEMAAQPPIVAPANRVQWIDDGPPKTVSRPMDVSLRFYRVIQNP